MTDVVGTQGWLWPQDWTGKYQILTHVQIPNLVDHMDNLVWKFGGIVWEAIRESAHLVDWFKIIWFRKLSRDVLYRMADYGW